MLITIVRHGETDFNKQGKIQGHIDNPLNEVGVMQAKKAGIYFQQNNITFDQVYSSDLKRARSTAEFILAEMNLSLEVKLDKRFRERDFGEFEGTDAKENLPHIFADCAGDYEHHQAIEQRVFRALEDVVKVGGEHVLITCHSHTIKCILVKLLADFKYNSFLANTAINTLSYHSHTFEVVDYNNILHLAEK